MWSLVENVHIVKVSSEEMGKAAKELHEAGMSIRKIAEELGISKDMVHKWTQTLRLPPQYSELEPEVERLPTRKKKPVTTTLKETKMSKKKAKELVDAAKELPSDVLRTYSTVAKEGGHVEPSVAKKMAKKRTEYVTLTIALPKNLYKKILNLSKAQSWDFNETLWKLLKKGLESL
jgi:transposase-like protein